MLPQCPIVTPSPRAWAAGRAVGVEITAFQSGTTTDDGVPLCKAEAWQQFEAASQAFRRARPHLHDLDVGLFFAASMPPRTEYPAFMEEISALVQVHWRTIVQSLCPDIRGGLLLE